MLSQQLEGLVAATTRRRSARCWTTWTACCSLLQKNQDNLDRGLQLLAPFYRVFNNAVGNGRWFDNYIQNLSGQGLPGLLNLAGS